MAAGCEPDVLPTTVAPPRLLPPNAPTFAEGIDVPVWSPIPSPDGRTFVFVGDGPPTVRNSYFLLDVETRTQTPIDVTSSGEGPDALATTEGAALSAGGGHIVFVSAARNLAPIPDQSPLGAERVFVRDVETGKIEHVATGGNVSISGAGRYVVFSTDEALDDADTDDGLPDMYRYDRKTGKFIAISKDLSDEAFGPHTAVSADGCVTAWQSRDPPQLPILIDLRKPESSGVLRLPVDPEAPVGAPSLSGDGRFVVFISSATNLVPDDTNAGTPGDLQGDDVFVFDRETSEISRVSVSSRGEEANAGAVNRTWISPDGRYILFYSHATNLDPTDDRPGGFIHDRLTKRTWRVPRIGEPALPEAGS